MRVSLMITPEATPFAQTGGLGEVMSALPVELAGLGVEVDVLMPKIPWDHPGEIQHRKNGPRHRADPQREEDARVAVEIGRLRWSPVFVPRMR